MSDILEPIVYLSQEVGPRPAGTEEEQQAALYVTEALSKDAGLSTVIEDFRGLSSPEPILALLCVLAFVISILATAFPVMDVVAVIVTAVTAIVFFTESFGRPILSRMLSRGVSQNVVAKYEPHLPSESGTTHARKVVLVARYDSGKVSRETSKAFVRFLPALQWFTLISVVALPVLLLLRTVFFPQGGGLISSIVNILIIVALIGTILPSVKWLLHKTAPYNEAANCNAAGVAVLLETARRVGQGRINEALISEQDAGDAPVIHDEDQAYAAGVVPEGAELVYEAGEEEGFNEGAQQPAQNIQRESEALSQKSSDQGLAAAKAAIAAMTGQPIQGAAQSFEEVYEASPAIYTQESEDVIKDNPSGEIVISKQKDSVDESLTSTEKVTTPTSVAFSQFSETSSQNAFFAAPETSQSENSSVPDWYIKAQEKAKKPRGKERPIQRSKYASALDAAVRESAGYFAEANSIVDHRLEDTLNAGLDRIQEVPAPGFTEEKTSENVIRNPWRERREAAAAQAAQAENTLQGKVAANKQESVDLGETIEIAPIDVTTISAETNSPEDSTENNATLPSFLDPRKVQQEALAARGSEDRSTTRVAVSEDNETLTEIDNQEGAATQVIRSESENGLVVIRENQEQSNSQRTQFEEAQQTFADRVNQRRRARRPVVLPDVDESVAKPAPVSELNKQRAPLAAGAGDKDAAKSLLTFLPAITAEDIVASHGGLENAQADPLLQALPSLSGAISRISAQASGSIAPQGTITPAGLTGTFAPIGDELVENMDPNDMYVHDVDDSAYDETFAESGAIATGEYLEMPKSRMQKFLGRFRHKKEESEVSAQEWLDVDENFDPRAVGAQRGGWESFRNNSEEDSSDDTYEDKTSWEGGAFNPTLNNQERRVESSDLDSEDIAEEAALAAAAPVEVDEELRQIYAFRNPDIDAEVWFVALGAELDTHDGMRAFLDEHEHELRGAILIDLDALGAGDLTMVESEGVYEQSKISSRLVRYAKKASQASGVPLKTTSITWQNSAATFAMRHSIQAMRLVGMDGKAPAYFGQLNDTLENISADKLQENTNFVMEILKNI